MPAEVDQPAATGDPALDSEEGARSKLLKKKNNGLIYAGYWHASMALAKSLSRWGVRANTISWLSLHFFIIGGVLFLQGTYMLGILGAVCYFLGFFMDTVDGKLARLSDDCSYLGVWLDSNVDYLKYLFVYPPMALALFWNSGDFLPLVLAMFAVGISLVSDILSMKWKQFPLASQEKQRYAEESRAHKFLKEFYWFEGIEPLVLLAFAALGSLYLFLIFWTALVTAKYLAFTLLLGRAIARKDRERKEASG